MFSVKLDASLCLIMQLLHVSYLYYYFVKLQQHVAHFYDGMDSLGTINSSHCLTERIPPNNHRLVVGSAFSSFTLAI